VTHVTRMEASPDNPAVSHCLGDTQERISNEDCAQDNEAKYVKKDTEVKDSKDASHLSLCFLCAKPAAGPCPVCGLVGVCGEEHQGVHRPEQFCFPFRVEQREGVGRLVVASRDIEPLELIMWDTAAAMGPRMGSPPVCLQCLKAVDGSFRCEECNWPMCRSQCAQGKAHAIECRLLKNTVGKVEFSDFSETDDKYRCIAPLRLLKVKEKIPETWERLSYLMDHNEDRSIGDPELWQTYQRHVNTFLKSLDPGLKDEDIDRAVGLLWTNAFACSNGGGQAIFPTFSFMSHSCHPNCSHSVFPNKTLALQAKMKILAGEEFTISYISPLQGLLKRKTKLRDKWYFSCNCDRCQDPTELESFTSALICQECQIPSALVLPTSVEDLGSEWKCGQCGDSLTAEQVNQTENRIAQEMQKIEPSSLVDYEAMLTTVSTTLHPTHYLTILLKRQLVGLYTKDITMLETKELERVKLFCEDLDKVYQIIDPGYQKDRGVILRALSETEKRLAKHYLNENKETEEQFSARVKKCIELFHESQKCMFVRIKKD